LASAAFDAGDFTAAVAHFRKALAQDPNNLDTRLHLASAERGKTSLIPTAPATGARSWRMRGNKYLEVLARDNGNRQALERLALLDVNMRQPQEARISR